MDLGGNTMRLGSDVLLEIVDIVRRGLVEGMDISDLLRELDLDETVDQDTGPQLTLSTDYLKKTRTRQS